MNQHRFAIEDFCPVSGLPVRTGPEWIDLPCGDDYRVGFQLIGERILYTRPCGDTKTTDIDALYAHRRLFLEAAFGAAIPPLVEIRDYAHIHGTPHRQARLKQKEQLQNLGGELTAFIIHDASFLVRNVFRAGLRLITPPFPILLVEDYKAAIGRARSLIDGHEIALAPDRIVRDGSWNYLAAHLRVEHAVEPGRLIWTRIEGALKSADVADITVAYRRLIAGGSFADHGFYRIADYRRVRGGRAPARVALAKAIRAVHQEFACRPRQLVVIGASTRVRTALRLTSHIYGYPPVFVDDDRQALAQVREDERQRASVSAPSVAPGSQSGDIEDLIRYLGSMTWDQSGSDLAAITDSNPLKPVYEAFYLVRDDISDLLDDARTTRSRVEEQNQRLREEIDRRQEVEAVLKTAIRQAEAANRAKGEFLANMSHEIRTPLNGIMGVADLLLHTELSGEQRGLVTTLRRSGSALLSIINDILDFSKIESGMIELEYIDFDLEDVLAGITDVFQVPLRDRGLTFACVVEAEVPLRLTGDPVRLRQILVNLVGNAVKFTARGHIEVRMRLLVRTGDAVEIECRVVDSGIGIARDKVDHLFESFTQADASTTRIHGGTGLGLAISRRLVDLMDGSISLRSIPGRGSTFFFRLPFRLPAQPESDRDVVDALRGRVVAVCDAWSVRRDMVAAMLRRYGVRPIPATDTEQARLLIGGDFECVVGFVPSRPAGLRGTPYLHLAAPGTARAEAIADASLRLPLTAAELATALASMLDPVRFEAMPLRESDTARYRRPVRRFAGCRVLVVEDNLVNQKVVRLMLIKLGCNVSLVGDGQQAIDHLVQHPCDLVLMDVQMPVMDGFEATRAIRCCDEDIISQLPIVGLTANAMHGDRDKCLEAGMDDYLAKPVGTRDLEAALDNLIGERFPPS